MKDYLEPILAAAVRQAHSEFSGKVPFEQPKMEAHGDIATPVAMNLAKQLKQPPRKIAEGIVKNIALDPELCSCEIAGAGFINFRFTPKFFVQKLAEFLQAGENIGKRQKTNRKVNIEFVSANPTGLLHLGHARQAALGDTVANLLDWDGWDVTREYYFNNAGRQMRQLAESIYARYRQTLGDDYPMPEDGYQGEYIKEIAEEIKKEKGATLRDTEDKLFFQKYGEKWCFTRITTSLDNMGVKHDIFFNEDTLYTDGKIEEVIKELRDKGLAYDKEGAVWFKLSDFGLEDRVIVKSTGEPTYRLPDIAYHREKLRRGYDMVLDIFGSDHQVTIPDVLAGVRALGYDSDKVKVLIHGWVNLIENGEMVKMSKRTGKSYTLDDLLEEFGADVVRFFLIMRTASSPLDFDLNLARDQSEKNPVYYLQYGHARIASILRFAEQEGIDPKKHDKADLTLLSSEEEQKLIKILLAFPEEVEKSAEYYEPHRLCEYLKNVAGEYHKFYHDHRVVGVDQPLMYARLALCIATLRVLKNGLTILGISAPDRMSKEG
jgi:arginyl-tRNA synthetase